MSGDLQDQPDFSDVTHDSGPEDPTPADVPRGEADVPKTDAAAEPSQDAVVD